MTEGAGPSPGRRESGDGGGIVSWPLLSLLLEGCTQVALNVDLGKARDPECFRVALVGRPSPLPAIGPIPQCQGVEARPWESCCLCIVLMHCRNCM